MHNRFISLDGAGLRGGGLARRYRAEVGGDYGELGAFFEVTENRSSHFTPIRVIVWCAGDDEARRQLTSWAAVAEEHGGRDIGICIGISKRPWPRHLISAANEDEALAAIDGLVLNLLNHNVINLRAYELRDVIEQGPGLAFLCSTRPIADDARLLMRQIRERWCRAHSSTPPRSLWLHLGARTMPALVHMMEVHEEARDWVGDQAVVWLGATANPRLESGKLRLSAIGAEAIR